MSKERMSFVKLIYYILPLIAGAGMTMQIGLNTKLRLEIGSPMMASLISFFMGTVSLGIVLLINVLYGGEIAPSIKAFSTTKWWMYFGGTLGAFYVFVSILTSPKIGFANMFSLILAGQIFLAVLVDHFGILGNNIHTINPIRIFGIILLMVGAYLIQTH